MVASSATDAAISKKIYGSGTTVLIISNEEMNDIMTIVKSFEKSGLLIKSVSETITNKAKEQKERFLGKLLDILGVTLLGNMLAIRGGEGVIQADEGMIKAGQDLQCFLIL